MSTPLPELLPCPLCGGEAQARNTITEGYVQCHPCRASVVRRHTHADDGLLAAIAVWNTRTPRTVVLPHRYGWYRLPDGSVENDARSNGPYMRTADVLAMLAAAGIGVKS